MEIETLNVNGFLSKQQLGCSKFIAPCLYYAYPSLGSNDSSASAVSTQEVITIQLGYLSSLTSAVFVFTFVTKFGYFQNSSGKVQQKKQRVLLIFYCIPVSPGESRVIWVFPRNFAVWMDKLIPRWILHVRNNLILDSDLYLLHLEVINVLSIFIQHYQ